MPKLVPCSFYRILKDFSEIRNKLNEAQKL